MKPPEYKICHHPTTSSTLCGTFHQSNNNNNKIQTQSSADRITTSLSLAYQRKNKQTNKSSAQISPYRKLTQTTGQTLGGQKPKGRKSSTLRPGKRRPQTQKLKK